MLFTLIHDGVDDIIIQPNLLEDVIDVPTATLNPRPDGPLDFPPSDGGL